MSSYSQDMVPADDGDAQLQQILDAVAQATSLETYYGEKYGASKPFTANRRVQRAAWTEQRAQKSAYAVAGLIHALRRR